MTLEELEALPREVLTCKQIAPILGAKADNLHQQAVERPERLGFPVIVIKSRVKIPKAAFISYMRGGAKG